MKLYYISQSKNRGYDTFDSAVVCAYDETMASNINPFNGIQMTKEDWSRMSSVWGDSPDQVKVEYLGEAAENMDIGLVCASFNAG